MAILELSNFISFFTEGHIDLERAILLNKAVYLPNSSAQQLLERAPEEPVATGKYLGIIKPKFKPSITLLRMLAPFTGKKIVLNEKSAWLFVCGRDAFPNNVLSGDMNAKQVIVQDEDGETLGLAKKQRDMYKNIVHVGQLLKNKQ